MELQNIAICSLVEDPNNPRSILTAIDELANSIASLRSRGLGVYGSGILEPILVRPNPNGGDGYMVISGHRRLAAALATTPVLDRIPALIDPKARPEAEKLAIQVIENSQRTGVAPEDTARAIVRFIDEFGMTRTGVADLLGVSNSTITAYIDLLNKEFEKYLSLLGGYVSLLPDFKYLNFEEREVIYRVHEKTGFRFSQKSLRRLKTWVKENRGKTKLSETLVPIIVASKSAAVTPIVSVAQNIRKETQESQPTENVMQRSPPELFSPPAVYSPTKIPAFSDDDFRFATNISGGDFGGPELNLAQVLVDLPAIRITEERARSVLAALGDHSYVTADDLAPRLLRVLSNK
jgi:ParB/RepB/Spo0J family partition protein